MEPNMNMGAPMQEEKKPVGAIIGIIVIVLVLAFGAFYFLKQVPTLNEGTTVTPVITNEQRLPEGDATVSALTTQSASTDIADIQKDLDASNFNTLDMGLNNVSI